LVPEKVLTKAFPLAWGILRLCLVQILQFVVRYAIMLQVFLVRN